jgi:type I site-specific restriction-modification system R (restriction) subunit
MYLAKPYTTFLPTQVENRDQLKELLQVASGGVIFSTIQKFQPDEGNVFDTSIVELMRQRYQIADHPDHYGR